MFPLQNLVEHYKAIPRRPQDGPLQCLVEQMENKDYMEDLCEHQEKVLPLIQVNIAHLRDTLAPV